jgi:cardiolipin synthase
MWGGVGTMNFDNRSMVFNDESMLVALDAKFGRQLDEIFMEDLKFSQEMKLDTFRKRPWTDKVMEQAAVLFSRLL